MLPADQLVERDNPILEFVWADLWPQCEIRTRGSEPKLLDPTRLGITRVGVAPRFCPMYRCWLDHRMITHCHTHDDVPEWFPDDMGIAYICEGEHPMFNSWERRLLSMQQEWAQMFRVDLELLRRS